MGDAAASLNMTIQYCMEEMPHLLQSTEIQAVTQARASGDYSAGSSSWKIGRNAQLWWALGIMPSKDTFWTNATQPGCPHGSEHKPCFEPNTDLVTLVSTMSLGPVGPGDRLYWSNASLIMKSCTTDGTLMRPDRPISPVDKTYIMATTQPDQEVVLWETESKLLEDQNTSRWHYVLTVEPPSPLHLTIEDIDDDGEFVVYDHFTKSIAPKTFSGSSPLSIEATYNSGYNISHNMGFMVLAPVLKSGWAMVGQASKFASASARRFSDIIDTETGLSVSLQGAANESVDNVLFVAPGMKAVVVNCVLSDSGSGKISCFGSQCKFATD